MRAPRLNNKIIYVELSPPIFTEEATEVEAGKDMAREAAGGILQESFTEEAIEVEAGKDRGWEAAGGI